MSDLISKIATGESPMEVSDEIKQMLMQKALERIETVRPHVVSDMFDLEDSSEEEWDIKMKSYRQFISESINIAGDFNGNLYINDSRTSWWIFCCRPQHSDIDIRLTTRSNNGRYTAAFDMLLIKNEL